MYGTRRDRFCLQNDLGEGSRVNKLYGIEWGSAFGAIYTANFIFWAVLADMLSVSNLLGAPSKSLEKDRGTAQNKSQENNDEASEVAQRNKFIALARDNAREAMLDCPLCTALEPKWLCLERESEFDKPTTRKTTQNTPVPTEAP